MKSLIIFTMFGILALVYCNEELKKHVENLEKEYDKVIRECEQEAPRDLSSNGIHCAKLCESKKSGFIKNGKFDLDRFYDHLKLELFNGTHVPMFKTHVSGCADEANKYNTECEVEHYFRECTMKFFDNLSENLPKVQDQQIKEN